MSGQLDNEADKAGPRDGTVVVYALTTGSVAVDLFGASYFNGDADYQGKFVSLTPNQTLYYRWSDSSGATVDETANGNGATVCYVLPANTESRERAGGRYLVMKGALAGQVRIYISETVKPGNPRVP